MTYKKKNNNNIYIYIYIYVCVKFVELYFQTQGPLAKNTQYKTVQNIFFENCFYIILKHTS